MDRNPCCSGIPQTPAPDRTRSLPNRQLDEGDEDFALAAQIDLGRCGGFEEEGEGFDEVAAGLFDGCALTGDVEFGAEGDITAGFALDDRG